MSLRTVATVLGAAAIGVGVWTGNNLAIGGGAITLVLVVLSCRLSARGGEW